MKQTIFYRNVRAGDQLDIFFISAIASLLGIRFFLYLTDYPQIGGNGLHIAHMLWGGLLMLISITLALSFLGTRIQRLAAVFGGLGFGIFIDEIGKFITSDNNYFYRPSVGIIYAVFVIMYLTFNFLSRKQKLSSREYQLNALSHLEEAILHNMDPLEKKRAHVLLAQANPNSEITRQLKTFLETVDVIPESKPKLMKRLLHKLDEMYAKFWLRRNNHKLVRAFFVFESLAFVLLIVWSIYNNFDDVVSLFPQNFSYDSWLLIGQLISSSVAAGFAVIGAFKLAHSRHSAFEEFRRATLINLFLTEFFIFSRIEFEALPGFVINVTILLLVTYVLHQEQRLQPRRLG